MAHQPMTAPDREQHAARVLEDQETLALMRRLHAVCCEHSVNAGHSVAALCSVAAQYLQSAPPGERAALTHDVTGQMTAAVMRSLQ